eukprot:COSAG04_NODE_14463_length_567_cov_0.694444_1_plen_64_part_01
MRTINFVADLLSNTILWELWQADWEAPETLQHTRVRPPAPAASALGIGTGTRHGDAATRPGQVY